MQPMKKYHFISGLPRAGSTLLSAILKQNPRFTSNISDPLLEFVKNITTTVHQSVGMASQCDEVKQQEIMRGIFDTYYRDGNEVCFNTNRGWSANTSLVKALYPTAKMIVCVRDIPWILDSFEKLNAKNPFTIKPLYNHQDLGTVYERTRMLMGEYQNQAGYVLGPLANVKQVVYSEDRDMICVVDYEALAKNPLDTMKRIYEFLGEPWFEHDFENVEDSYDEFDEQAKIAGLHTVKRRVEYTPRKPILPEDLFLQYSAQSFWKSNFDHIKRQINWIG
jgi:sulfotransferase